MAPLFDVQLLGSTMGGQWSLSRVERTKVGSLGDECTYGQTWRMKPAPEEHLMQATLDVQRMWRLLLDAGIDPGSHPKGD